jgi:PhnB protein
MASVQPVPKGLRTLTPQLTVEGAAEAIELYKKAFGAEEVSRAMAPDGKKIWHAEVRIGDSVFFIYDKIPEMGPAYPADLWIYTDNADAMFSRAAEAGLEVVMPMADQFWGDRMGALKDRWGNHWSVGQHVKDLTPEEMRKAGEDYARQRPAVS